MYNNKFIKEIIQNFFQLNGLQLQYFDFIIRLNYNWVEHPFQYFGLQLFAKTPEMKN